MGRDSTGSPGAIIPEALLDFPETGLIFEKTLPAALFRGDPASPLAFLYGANGAGKSFYLRVLAQIAIAEGYEPLMVSMGLRTASGFHKCFMYSPFGDSQESSGLNSFVAVRGAMNTASAAGRKCLVILDEPDIGMSDGYAEALGEWLAAAVLKLQADGAGVMLCTHSKPLVRRYLECAAHRPHAVHLYGDGDAVPRTLTEWLENRETFSAAWLESHGKRATALRKKIDVFLDTVEDQKSEQVAEPGPKKRKPRATVKKKGIPHAGN